MNFLIYILLPTPTLTRTMEFELVNHQECKTRNYRYVNIYGYSPFERVGDYANAFTLEFAGRQFMIFHSVVKELNVYNQEYTKLYLFDFEIDGVKYHLEELINQKVAISLKINNQEVYKSEHSDFNKGKVYCLCLIFAIVVGILSGETIDADFINVRDKLSETSIDDHSNRMAGRPGGKKFHDLRFPIASTDGFDNLDSAMFIRMNYEKEDVHYSEDGDYMEHIPINDHVRFTDYLKCWFTFGAFEYYIYIFDANLILRGAKTFNVVSLFVLENKEKLLQIGENFSIYYINSMNRGRYGGFPENFFNETMKSRVMSAWSQLRVKKPSRA